MYENEREGIRCLKNCFHISQHLDFRLSLDVASPIALNYLKNCQTLQGKREKLNGSRWGVFH